jgi:8-oxo-dGTP pyrophosphatase MutT (NUDIX family)
MPAAASRDIRRGVTRMSYPANLQAKPYAVTNFSAPDSLERMIREISAGGVVIRPTAKGWEMAAIEPQKAAPAAMAAPDKRKGSQKMLLALPKGLVDPNEKPDQAVIREVREETGLTAQIIAKLKDIKYAYIRSWGDQQRVFKIVSFYLLIYQSGTIDDIDPAMRIEVKRAIWMPLEDAANKLAYRGEREVAGLAEAYLKLHPEA